MSCTPGWIYSLPAAGPAGRALAQTARVECRIVDRMVVFAHDTATLPPVEDLDVAACADVGASRVAHRVDTAFVAAATPVSPPL